MADQHTGIMIALMVPEKDATKLALQNFDGALAASDLHITLFMMGDTQDTEYMTLDKRALLDTALKAWAANHYPFAVQVSGMGIFQAPSGSSDGNALILLIDSIQLDEMRDDLEEIFASLGISFSEWHSFNPHITLAYLPQTSSLASVAGLNIPSSFVYFPEITLAWGDWRTSYPFKSYDDYGPDMAVMSKEKAVEIITDLATQGKNIEEIIEITADIQTTKAANFGAKMGQNIAGRLIRGAGGRFAASGPADNKPGGAAKKPAGDRPETPSKSATQAAKDKAKEDIAAAKKADKETAASQATDEMYQRFGDTLVAIGADPDITEVMSVGDYPGDIAGANEATQKKLVDAGLGQMYPDGTFDLTPTGRTLVKAAKKGDEKMAKRAMATAKVIADKKKAAAAKKGKKTKKEFDIETSPQGTTFKIFQQADGKYRWVTQSSSAFKDKDGHYVTLKSLTADVEYADKTGDYGTLRFWHEDGADIGICDYNAMHGAILIESGLFTNDLVAQGLAISKKEWGVSLGFKNFTFEPGADGTFNYIRRFERSVLPLEKASNWFTKLLVTKKEKDMKPDKFQELVTLLGGNVEAAQQIVQKAETTQKGALEAGATFKEVQTPDANTPYVAEMSQEELGSFIDTRMKASQQPILDAITALGTQQTAKETSAVTEIKTQMAGMVAQITALSDTVKGLTGETSKAFNQRASMSMANIIAPEQAETLKQKAPAPDPFDSFMSDLNVMKLSS